MSENRKVIQAEEFFKRGYACSQAVLMTYAEEYGIPVDAAKKIASTFGGGMGRLRLTCGALTGAFMVLGLEYGNVEPRDMDTKLGAYEKVRETARRFEELHGSTECRALLAKYCGSEEEVKSRKHHLIICNRLVRDAVSILEEVLGQKK